MGLEWLEKLGGPPPAFERFFFCKIYKKKLLSSVQKNEMAEIRGENWNGGGLRTMGALRRTCPPLQMSGCATASARYLSVDDELPKFSSTTNNPHENFSTTLQTSFATHQSSSSSTPPLTTQSGSSFKGLTR